MVFFRPATTEKRPESSDFYEQLARWPDFLKLKRVRKVVKMLFDLFRLIKEWRY